MIRTITIVTLGVLLSASLLFTTISPCILTALDIYTFKMSCKLIVIGFVVSFILATILTLVCIFWKNKKEN